MGNCFLLVEEKFVIGGHSHSGHSGHSGHSHSLQQNFTYHL
jgi:hypothetical protein